MSSTLSPLIHADASDRLGSSHLVSDAAVLALYAPERDDPIGLIAYALHRHALVEWVTAFTDTTTSPPDDAAFSQFYISETMQGRIAAYRAEAERIVGMRDISPSTTTNLRLSAKEKPRNILNWGLEEAIAHAKGPIPWRALAMRLLLLLLAVVVTALVLRVLFVPH